jgi:HSP20 family protein
MPHHGQAQSGQSVPVKLYRTSDRMVIAALMPGLEPDEVTVEVTAAGGLVLHGDMRGMLKAEVIGIQATDAREGDRLPRPDDAAAPGARWVEAKEVLLDEWGADAYHRELDLAAAVDGALATVTYANGVLVVALPVVEHVRPARLSLDAVGPGRGERVGSAGHPVQPLSTAEHRAAALE